MDMVMEKASGSAPVPGGGWAHRIFGIVVRADTYKELLYLLLSFPIGLAAFVALVTFLSVGLSLAVTLVGIPLLVLTMYGWCLAADGDRALTNALLGTRIPRLPFAAAKEAGLFRRIWVRTTNQHTWRSLLYLFLRFPHGLASFILLQVLVGVPLMAFSLPFHYWAHEIEIGPNWEIDTLGKALLFAVPAPFVLLAGLHALSWVARGSGFATGWLLGGAAATDELAGPAELGDLASWRGLTLTGRLEGEASRLQSSQVRAFRWHAIISGTLMVFLAVVNVASATSYPWSIWAIWGLAIPLTMHAGYLLRGWIGLHVGLFAIVNLGLFAIDISYGEGYWFYWPLIGWGIAVVISAMISRALRERPAPIAVDGGGPGVASGDSDDFESRIEVDVEMRRVTVQGADIELTPKEFELLVLLFANPGRPFQRSELLDRIWNNDYEVTDRTVDATVVRLRRKLGARAEDIQTVWGVGYRYSPGN